MTLRTFRDTAKSASPPWLQRFWGSRLIYALTVPLDALTDALTAAIQARFPNVYTPETLAPIGRERGITRGPEESAASYATRLRSWLDDHKRAGNPYTLLRQLRGYLTPHAVKMRIVNNAGIWYTQNADGSLEYHVGSNWDWDGATDQWSRFWIILYPPVDLWTRSVDGTWGGDASVWGETSGTWGSSATKEQVEAIRALVAAWTAPHARCRNIIVCFDDTAFDPTDTAPPLPDGTWAYYGVNVAGTEVATARDDRAIYWGGVF